MGKSSGSQPAAPDPAQTAAAQAAANKEAAIASARINQIDEVTPFGSSFYKPTGETVDGIERYKRITELAPEQQQMLDQQNAIGNRLLGLGQNQLGRIEGAVSSPFSLEGLPGSPTGNPEERARIEADLYNRATSRLDPRFETDRRRLETKLANQGFSLDSEGYDQAFDDFERNRTDAYRQAEMDATAQAGNEQSRMFGLESAARERALQEMIAERGMPLNELSAFMGTSPGLQIPQFSPIPTSGVAPADITGPTQAAYQGALSGYNNQQANKAATTNAAIGAAAMGAAMFF